MVPRILDPAPHVHAAHATRTGCVRRGPRYARTIRQPAVPHRGPHWGQGAPNRNATDSPNTSSKALPGDQARSGLPARSILRNGMAAGSVQGVVRGKEFERIARVPAGEAESLGSLLWGRGCLERRTMNRILIVMLLCGLAAAALSGCYVVSPYAYPAAYPSPYMPPSSGGPAPPRPGDPATGPPPSSAAPRSTPGAAGTSQGPAQNCQTVTVEGHYETHSKQSGQRETIWIPTRTEQICQ